MSSLMRTKSAENGVEIVGNTTAVQLYYSFTQPLLVNLISHKAGDPVWLLQWTVADIRTQKCIGRQEHLQQH